MPLYFSQITQGFYDTDFVIYPSLPSDIVEVTSSLRTSLLTAQQQGFTLQIVSGVATAVVLPTPALSVVQQAVEMLNKGLTIISSSTSELNAVYPTDSKSISKYTAVQLSITATGNFPNGTTLGAILDMSKNWHSVNISQYTAIVSAVSAFVSSIDLVIDGYPGATLPNSNVNIA
jgi:hypothetical protein